MNVGYLAPIKSIGGLLNRGAPISSFLLAGGKLEEGQCLPFWPAWRGSGEEGAWRGAGLKAGLPFKRGLHEPNKYAKHIGLDFGLVSFAPKFGAIVVYVLGGSR